MMGARTALSRAGARRRTPPHEACGRSAARTLAEKLDCRLCRPLGWVVMFRIVQRVPSGFHRGKRAGRRRLAAGSRRASDSITMVRSRPRYRLRQKPRTNTFRPFRLRQWLRTKTGLPYVPRTMKTIVTFTLNCIAISLESEGEREDCQ